MDTPNTMTAAVRPVESAICRWLTKSFPTDAGPFSERLDSGGRTFQLRNLVWSLGHRYGHASLSDFEVYDDRQQAALDRLCEFVERMPQQIERGGLILFGPAGTGKDYLLAAVLKLAVARHGFTAAWWDGMSLFSAARHAISQDAELRLKSRAIPPSDSGNQ